MRILNFIELNNKPFMKKFFTIIFLLIINLPVLFSNPDLGATDKAKVELAKQKLYAGRFNSALSLFKEVYTDNPDDGVAIYYLAETYFKLNKVDTAIALLKKGKGCPNPKSDNFFLLGQIYLRDGKIDDALAEFTMFKSVASQNEMEEKDVELYIAQCNNFKLMSQKPIPVKVENLGESINSTFDDVTPSISADGLVLVFNSRRPETTDAPMDIEGDGKYFQDIYISHFDTVAKKWESATPVPGQVNTDGAHEACTGISPDGKQIYIYKNDLNDPESRGGDIFISKVSNNKWKTPEALGKPINSSYWEGGACISPDGKTIYFTSERKGGKGRSDIWMCTRKSKTEWNKPENLGDLINSEFDEAGIFLAPDGKTMFFSSNGLNSMGSYDIFRTTFKDGKWTKPVNLGYPINTERRDGPLVISADAQKAYIASDRVGGLGESDIYVIDLKNFALLEPDFVVKQNNGLSILKGMARDGYEGKGMEGVEISILLENGEKVASTITNENGEYFITLKGNMNYQVKAEKSGFKTVYETINLLLGKGAETFTLEKQFLMNKN